MGRGTRLRFLPCGARQAVRPRCHKAGQGAPPQPNGGHHELQDRAVEAAARFLEVRGYETLATGWKSPETRGTIDLVARDPESDDLVFVDVSARPNSGAGFGDGRNDRETMELLAVSWLVENDFAESVGVRFDKISMIVVGEDRALLRHHINAFGEA